MISQMESTIAPGFLAAAPHMRDPFFEKTLVFMMEHSDEGSIGLIINQPSNIDLATVLCEMELFLENPIEVAAHPPILMGGPVAPQLGWILHSSEWCGPETRVFEDNIAVTASREILQDISAGRGPERYLFCLGYAGWGPGQLVAEIKTGAWINVPCSHVLVLVVPIEDKWRSAITSLGIDPSNIVSIVGDA